ncbi:MAG: CPBP family intramembrane glutamic endopeptidase [bacterium]
MPPDASRHLVPTVGRAVAFVVFYVICTAAASEFLLRPFMWVATTTRLGIRADMYLELVSALAATAIMLRSIDRREWKDVGMSRAALRVRPVLTGLFVGGGAIVFTCVVLLVTGLLRFTDAPTQASWLGAAVRVTIVLAPAALAEEIICRGYLLTVVRDSVGIRSAVLLTSVMFGLLHLANPGATAESVAVVMVSGLLLGTVRVALDSMYAAWMAHLAWNWVMAVPVHAAVSGIQFEAPRYVAVSAGPAWLSGGTWGPEGGVIAAVGMMAGLAYFHARHRREES